MSKITIKGFIVCEKSPYSDNLRFEFMMYTPTPKIWPNRVVVAPHEFEAEIPDNFSPIPDLVANLVEQKRLKRVQLAEELANIDEQISKLTCITNEVAA